MITNDSSPVLNPLYLRTTHDKGTFITIEGIDGSGKATLVEKLVDYYRQHDKEVVVVREPGGCPTSEVIRNILKNPDNTLDQNQELLLFYTARISLVREVILPALQEDKVVISDRFFHSTFAMQYWASQCDPELFGRLTDQIVEMVNPDITLFIDVLLDTAAKRRVREGQPDRFDGREDEYHKKVREGFLLLDALYDNRYQRIEVSAEDSPERVTEKALAILDAYVPVEKPKAKPFSNPWLSFLNGLFNTVSR